MQMSNEKVPCAACGHDIDRTAKLCPFCGGNPVTGEKFDARPVLERHFSRKEKLTPTEGAVQFVRDRQTIVVTGVIAFMLVAVFGIHRFMQARNANAVTDVPAVPLTEVTDLSNQSGSERDAPLPDLDFEYEGNPKTMRTLLMEPGAVAPPPPPAAPGAQAAAAAPASPQPSARPAVRPQATTPPQQRPAVQQPTPPPASRQ